MLLFATLFNAYYSETTKVTVTSNIVVYAHFQDIYFFCIVYKSISMQIRIWGTSLSLSVLTRLIEDYLPELRSAPTELSQILTYGLEYRAVKLH